MNAAHLDLPLFTFHGRETPWACVPATVVDVAPHLWPYTFALHRHWHAKGFGVSNIETGFLAAHGHTRGEALLEARLRLAGVSPRRMARMIAAARRIIESAGKGSRLGEVS